MTSLPPDSIFNFEKPFPVKWDTTPDPRQPTVLTTLPPDVHVVNNIWYHMVHDPCDLSSDGVCPMKCTEKTGVKPDGRNCTMCDCQGNGSSA